MTRNKFDEHCLTSAARSDGLPVTGVVLKAQYGQPRQPDWVAENMFALCQEIHHKTP
jgi:nucleoside-diphosphate-sugar epimerase